MALWQWALLLLGIVWALQALGVWFQMRHYSDVFKGISKQYADGYVGAGHVKGRFGKGTIAVVVVSPDLVVRHVLTMSGRSVFAKFKTQEQYNGLALDQLRENEHIQQDLALIKAIEQVDRIWKEKNTPPMPEFDSQQSSTITTEILSKN